MRIRIAGALAGAAALVSLIFFAGCSRPAEPGPKPDADPGPLAVVAGIPPIGDVVERVGGSRVAVQVLIGAGQDPHSYEPSPRQMSDLGKARIFFKAGMPFEEWVAEKVGGIVAGLTVVDVGVGIKKRKMEEPDEDEPDHEEDGHDHHDHHAGEPDPHIWLSPPLLKVIAGNVARALIAADPAHRSDYEKNLAAFSSEIDAEHKRIEAALGPYRGRTFYVFHPAFGYFGDAYGLKQMSVEAGGKSPTPKQIEALIARARSDGVKVIFVQPQFDPRSAETIARAIGSAVAPMDPLAHDVVKNFGVMAAEMEKALK